MTLSRFAVLSFLLACGETTSGVAVSSASWDTQSAGEGR